MFVDVSCRDEVIVAIATRKAVVISDLSLNVDHDRNRSAAQKTARLLSDGLTASRQEHGPRLWLSSSLQVSGCLLPPIIHVGVCKLAHCFSQWQSRRMLHRPWPSKASSSLTHDQCLCPCTRDRLEASPGDLSAVKIVHRVPAAIVRSLCVRLAW